MKNMKIAAKLALGYGVAILILLAISGFSFLSLEQTDSQWHGFEKNDIAKKDLIADGNRALGDAIHHFKNYVLRGGEYDKKFVSDIGSLKHITDTYRTLANTTGEERELLKEIAAAADAYLADMGKLVQLRANGTRIEDLDKAIKGADKPIYSALEKLQTLAAEETERSGNQFGATLDNAKETTIVIMLLALVLMATLSVAISWTIVKPLREALAVVNGIAEGDLQTNIDLSRRDEVGQVLAAMQRMSDTLRSVLADTGVLIKAVSMGDLEARADADRYQGEFRSLVAGFNDTIAAVSEPIKITSDYLEQIAKGMLPSAISTDYRGAYRVIRDNLNRLVKLMSDLQAQIDIVIQAAASGELDKRADADGFSGEWKKLVQGINRSLDNIVLPIGEVVGVLARLEQGDLTVNVKGNYQGQLGDFKDTVNNTVAQLAQTIAEVMDAAGQLGSASEQITATAQSLSQAASEQAAGVEETSSSIDQMAGGITQNAENAEATCAIAGQAAQEAAEGGVAVKQTLEAMKVIAGKIGIVDDIAYQTNMLALNAAIEAARAGEQGKGFAVVAAEVRKLAERSQTAAQEIGQLAETSVNTAERAGRFLDEIVPSISKTSSLMQDIAAASQEQSAGVSQVNTAMRQMNQITQQNASASEELASTAEEMAAQAEQLRTLMGFFNIGGAGLNMAREEIDLNAAIQAHGEWKAKLSDACLTRERLDSATISRDDCCKLGKWLHGTARRDYRQLAGYTECVKKHAAFHREAGRVAEVINSGEYAAADTLLKDGSRYAVISAEVCKAIMALKLEAGL